MIHLGGALYNLLGRGSAPVVMSDSDALFPPAKLSDGLPGNMSKFGSNGADRLITKDLNDVVNPGFETSTLASWVDRSTGTGTKAETSVGAEVHGGAKAAKLGGGAAGVGMITQDILARAGEWRVADVWTRGDGAKLIRYQIQNLQNGWFLAPSGVWQAAAVDLFTRSVAGYTNNGAVGAPFQYQVQGWDVLQASTVTLRLIAYCNEAGFGFIDDITDYPMFNFCGVFFHNHAPVLTPQFRSSNDGFAANDVLEATLTPYQPSYYGYLAAAVGKRWVRLKLSGTNPDTPYQGEVVIGYGLSAVRGPSYGWPSTFTDPQLRSEGGEYVFLLSQAANGGRRRLKFRRTVGAQYLEALQDIYFRCRGGGQPLIVIPKNGERDIMLGRIDPTWEPQRPDPGYTDDEIPIDPLPFPSIVT
jgi:hypothetical protein